MDSRTTSIDSPLPTRALRIATRRRAGFTLVESLVSLAITSVILLTSGALTYYSGRSFVALSNYADLDMYSRNALDLMSKEIRQSNYLINGADHFLVFNDSDGVPLAYVYHPETKRLLRIKGGQTKELLKNCDSLQFQVFQRNPIGGTYDQFPTANPATCKLVQLNWTCSRTIMGLALNTESVQSAKIVIRKQ